MNLTPLRCSVLVAMIGLLAVRWVVAETGPKRRARPPEWNQIPRGVFFEDAFREGLRGTRPDTLGHAAGANGGARSASATPPPSETGKVDATSGWSTLISAASIEDEIKAIKMRADQALRTQGYFKAQGYREIRQHFATAATLFAIIEQYEGPVRWKDSAARARTALARAAQNAKVSSSQVYREANARRQDLADLIRGSRLTGEATSEEIVWGDLADRKLLMQRLEWADQETLAAGVASAAELAKQQGRLQREAELTAVIARILTFDGLEDAGDEDYDQLCRELLEAAKNLATAAEEQKLDAAQKAHGDLKNRCVSCHELYRA